MPPDAVLSAIAKVLAAWTDSRLSASSALNQIANLADLRDKAAQDQPVYQKPLG